jgi:hypothetical protein
VAADAGSEVLDDPGEAAREALRLQTIARATAHLRGVGDRYVDPLGITWKLID